MTRRRRVRRHRGAWRPLVGLALVGLALACLPAAARAQGGAAQGGAPRGGAMVSGLVYDSLARAPLAFAVVQLVSRPDSARPDSARAGAGDTYSAVADGAGVYHIDGVRSGRYVAGFFHPALDSLGLQAPLRSITVDSGAAVRVDLALPSARTILAALCRGRAPNDSSGLLIGFIRSADTGEPLPGSTLVVSWSELVIDKQGLRLRRQVLPAQVAPAGWYQVCDVPTDAPVAVRAARGADSSGLVELQVPPRGVLVRDVSVGSASSVVVAQIDSGRQSRGRRAGPPATITVRRGTARLTGLVQSSKGRPLAGATAVVWGTGVQGVTGEDGRFALAELPAGTYSVEVRYIGYAPKRVVVDLASDRTTATTVVLDTRATVLDEVRVFGKRSTGSDITGFLERMRRGFGYYLTRDQIEKRGTWRTTDLLRTVPGVRVVPNSSLGYIVLLRGNCVPVVYLDGMRIAGGFVGGFRDDAFDDIDTWVHPDEIAGMEVYPSGLGAPPQYSGNGCGTILIWTGPRLK